MNDFNIGDKVRVKKLSEKEFEEIYHKKHYLYWSYHNYLNFYNRFSNQILEIIEIIVNMIYCKNLDNYYFFEEELEKVSYIKTKFKIIKELLKNE